LITVPNLLESVKGRNLTLIYVLVPVLLVGLLFLVVAVLLYRRLNLVLSDENFKAFMEGKQQNGEDKNTEQEMISGLSYNTKYEIHKRQIKICEL